MEDIMVKDLSNREMIPILFCISAQYVKQLIVCITSILENNKDVNFVFYVFHRNLSKDNEKLFASFDKNHCKFIFKKLDDNLFKDFRIVDEGRHDISIDIYSRYFAPKIIKEHDKMIYLDSDIIVNGSLSPLYQINLGDNYVGGVEERCLYQTNYVSNQLKFKENELYINAGVLLMNLEKMRKDNFVENFSKAAPILLNICTYSDQDVLNIVAKGKIKKINCIYNMTPFHIRDLPSKKNAAVIIHYTGKFKPWTLGYTFNDANSLYLDYFNRSFLAKQQRVKIFCIYHSPQYILENELISPIQTGNYGKYNGMDMIQSCDGCQIDKKNKNYGELTAWYWVWKNYLPENKNIEYVGFCHYRRILDFKSNKQDSFMKIISLSKFLDLHNNDYDYDDVYNTIKGYDVVLPKKYTVENNLTIEQQYLNFHPKKDLELLKEIIKNKYPDMVPVMYEVLNEQSAYFCLLYMLKREHYINFMKFTFDILFELENRSDWSSYNEYYTIRAPAYLIERFFNVWLVYHSRKYNWKILERDAYIFEEYLPNNINNNINKNNYPSKEILKFLNIPVFKKKIKSNKIKYYILGLPIWKTKVKGNTQLSYLFGGIPLIKRIFK